VETDTITPVLVNRRTEGPWKVSTYSNGNVMCCIGTEHTTPGHSTITVVEQNQAAEDCLPPPRAVR